MSEQQEPENYSLDQMMDRLQRRTDSVEETPGERVIRADGTEAIRVKRRKRRSSQPKHEKEQKRRRIRIIQLSGALALLMVFGLVVGVAMMYANSEPYRKGVVQKVRATLGGEVQLGQYRMTPSKANAGLLKVDWPTEGLLQRLEARGVSAEVEPSVFLGSSFKGEEVLLSEASLYLNSQGLGSQTGVRANENLHFQQIRAMNFNVFWNDELKPQPLLYRTEAVLKPDFGDARSLVLLNRGEVYLPGWPKQELVRAHVELAGDIMELKSMRIKPTGNVPGEIELSGRLFPYQSERESELAVKLTSYPMEALLGSEWNRLFNGSVSALERGGADNSLTLTHGHQQGATLQMQFESAAATKFTVMNFSFLKLLAVMMGNDWYERPVFESGVLGKMKRSASGVSFENFELLSRNRLVLRYNLQSSADMRLKGTVDIGVPEGVIQSSTSAKLKSFFTRSDRGYYWVQVDIDGTVMMPTDNFRTLFEGVASPKIDRPRGDQFEELTNPNRSR